MGSGTSFACVEGRARRNASISASTNAAATGGTRASAGGVESLRTTPAPRQSEEMEQLRAELARVTLERDDYKCWQQKALTPEKRDRILAALGIGKQSPQFKRVKTELDKLL